MLCLLKKRERVKESPNRPAWAPGLDLRVPAAAGPEPAGPRRLREGVHPVPRAEQPAPGPARPHALRLSVPDVGEPDKKATQVCSGGPAVPGVGLCPQTKR